MVVIPGRRGGAPLTRADKSLALLIAAILIAGLSVAGVRGSRGPDTVAQPTAGPSFTESPTPSETLPTEEPSPSVTMTFSGLPPFDQTGTPTPKASPGEKLPHTGTGDGGLVPIAVMMLVMALGAAGLLARAER